MGFLLGLSVTGGSFEERRIWSHMSILHRSMHMEQYLTHYKHTVGITVGFRDVGDMLPIQVDQSITKLVSENEMPYIKHQYDTSYHQSRLPCRLGSDRGQCYWFR